MTLDSEEARYFRSLLEDLILAYYAPVGFRRCYELIKDHKIPAPNGTPVEPAVAQNISVVSHAVPMLCA